ncbi:DUF2254 domain-containing protein [Pelagivirga sediminicola]|uniref:DUF2254 domain-containing protein n=1 Tax=Pelagivirga sediminicola TaxID=2170575 RepID=A0A2T7GBN4_9RHOB|nr:DUF2254 domain-containing protein [Pelagivirga sediminicola]PVA11840.1 DUF2254 domain-containing protein [Pelagivirga sediminicola]
MKNILLIPSTLWRKARNYSRKLWVRVLLMGMLSLFALGLTQLIELFVPEQLAGRLSGTSADRLLDIIASAMLSVTIFSMTVMVSTYRSSASQWTPRVHQLIMQDSTTQKTLAAFIGAWVYALIAIILRETSVFGDEHALVIFWLTVLVLAYVVWSLVRWVLHLQTFGSLLHTTRQVEDITKRRFKERLKTPCLGANPLRGDVPRDATSVASDESGYIQHIYPEGLQAVAERYEVRVYLPKPIGEFVFLHEPLLWYEGRVKEDDREEFLSLLRGHVSVEDLRSYDQDPRFGLTVMGEIASKALSPGINDPGTAIDVITRVGRILSSYSDENVNEEEQEEGGEGPDLDRLWVPPLSPGNLLDDGFGALSRDGAQLYEVQHRLQATLAGLMQHPDAGLRNAAEKFAELALRRALDHMDFAPDRDRLLAAVSERLRLRVTEA